MLERFEFKDEIRKSQRRRHLAYENVMLFQAKTREQAYRKAMRYGKLEQAESTNMKFLGAVTTAPSFMPEKTNLIVGPKGPSSFRYKWQEILLEI